MLRSNGVGWDWRHRLYEAKKHYLAALVELGYGVLQADIDVVWAHDPFPPLVALAATGVGVIVQSDHPLANAGLMYATSRVPGRAPRGRALLAELAWRVKLFQRHPDLVGRVVRFATPPYYSNPDDQTLLNDVMLSFALHNRTYLISTARLEAASRHNGQRGPLWSSLPEAAESSRKVHEAYALTRRRLVSLPEGNTTANLEMEHGVLPIGGGEGVALASRALFGMTACETTCAADMRSQALSHLAPFHGFALKRRFLKKHGLWHPDGPPSAFDAALDVTRYAAARPRGSPIGAGYCAATVRRDNAQACVRGGKGSWELPLHATATPRAAAAACQALCAECERCRFISVSALHRDCSWFARCDTALLRTNVDGFQTWHGK